MTHEETTKRELLNDIERLIAYGKEEPVINPALLRYLSVEELENIKAKLIERVGKLDEEDKAWLQRFKKED